MQLIKLELKNDTSRIYIGSNLINDATISKQCADLANHFVIITDNNVADLYAHSIFKQLEQLHKTCTFIKIAAGETSKTRETKQSIENTMLAAECTRDTAVIAVGGGVVTDLAGFVASTYCRGIKSIYIPTTLLAMVDAAIGGKTAVNTASGKNLIGSFYQPHSVFCDITTLDTLSHDELANGLVETLKHALIIDYDLFQEMDEILDMFARQQPLTNTQLKELVSKSCKIKCKIVALDTHEKGGIRQLLNFGHTTAHAIERELQYSVSHGQAVLAGLWVASCIANLLSYLSDAEFIRIKTTLAKINYSKPLCLSSDQLSHLQQHMILDKKSINKKPRFVLIKGIGSSLTKNNKHSLPVDEKVVAESIQLWARRKP